MSAIADDNGYRVNSGTGFGTNQQMENQAVFTSPGVNSEQSYDSQHFQYQMPNRKVIGIIPSKDNSFCSLPDDDNYDATEFFNCMLKKGKKVGIGFKIICKQTGDINDLSTLSNYNFQWESAMESARHRTNLNGEFVIYLKVRQKLNHITIKSGRFERKINLAKGPYELLLEQKECNPAF